MIEIYGISASRALRPLWLLEEIGIEYQHHPIDFRHNAIHSKEYLAINPNGRIPALVDGDLVLCESMAINLYLAQNYGGALYPDNTADIARSTMWSFWVMTEVEHNLLTVLLHTRILPKPERQAELVEHHRKLLTPPFAVLAQALHGQAYLLGEDFTVADLNVMAVLSWCSAARVSLKPWPNLQSWLKKGMSRAAFKAATRK